MCWTGPDRLWGGGGKGRSPWWETRVTAWPGKVMWSPFICMFATQFFLEVISLQRLNRLILIHLPQRAYRNMKRKVKISSITGVGNLKVGIYDSHRSKAVWNFPENSWVLEVPPLSHSWSHVPLKQVWRPTKWDMLSANFWLKQNHLLTIESMALTSLQAEARVDIQRAAGALHWDVPNVWQVREVLIKNTTCFIARWILPLF